MKLRTATPASRSQALKRVLTLAVTAVLVVTSTIMYYRPQPVAADQYDDKIRALQADMDRYQVEADRLNAESISLSNTVAQLTNQKNALQAQIDLSQAQYNKLVADIAETQTKITNNQDALGKTLADLYVDSGVTPIEMLASSSNIGDFLDKQEYRNSVKDQLNTTIKKVKELKAQLSDQKSQVEKVLAEQKSARDSLAARESEQAALLAKTQNNEANYQNLIKDSQSQIAAAKAQQAVMRARSNATGGYQLVDGGSLGAYPWNESNCPMMSWLSTGGADGNGGDGHGYGCRQCASYVAWRVARETNVYYQWGNGGNFASAAIAAGYQDLGNNPQKNSLAVMWGNPGHVAYVEAVSDDGSKVLVTQYNYDYGAGWGMYSEMWLSRNFFSQYVKIK